MSDLIEEINKIAAKAVKATNLCTLHMQYHGQSTKECTPQERVIIEVKQEDSDA